ncbi:hypothetical protein [Pedobacter sp. L105]|uniref:hypothetical protein n=1 Tax=Pedobacter sp. L105 TaxID=1641871 RepID=UPI00131DBC93|nr:hypothetical protein [Pedobacter sp. L105]
MKSKFTLVTVILLSILITSCSKSDFNENDALAAQTALLNLKYQHELDLETLKQKGATAMQELINSEALQQIKLNDSLANASAIAAKKADYSVTVVDVYTNAPVADADVVVSSEGKVYAAKTSTQGVATFTSLYLFPTSTFLISKTGYAATQILQQNITTGAARLWNTADLSNEIAGNLYIDTDLTNVTPEKVGANVLVTASTIIPNGSLGSYTVYFPTYTTAAGAYSIKLPPAPSGYSLSFQQITADQKLYVNATEDDAVKSFPGSLPRLTTIKTYFNVNSYGAVVPTVNNYYYFKIAADKAGKTLYIPGYSNYSGYNQVLLSPISGKYQVEKLLTYNYYYSNGSYIDYSSTSYDPNTKIDVDLVDVAGNIVETAPKLSATSGADGKLLNYTSPEGGSGYIHLKRDATGALVPNAKGVILKAVLYDSYSNLYSLNYTGNLNATTNNYASSTYLLINKGDKKVVNFYYGSGDSRDKDVY